jgi:signal transduction histidine kinase
MPYNLISIDDRLFTPAHLLKRVLANFVINTVIAVVLTAIHFGRGFVPNLIFSQCIGFSIFFSTAAAMPLLKRAASSRTQVMLIVAVLIFGALAGTLLGALANGISLTEFIGGSFGFFSQVLVLALLFGAIVSYVFFSVARISEEKMKRLDMEKVSVETELRLLQSQMEPHFLFNTLSNVLSLMDSDREKARSMLESFTAFLRASFLTARHRTVTLAQEMDVVKNYLDVFAVRMGVRLAYHIDLPEGLRSIPIPPLLIQPLVENAVKHGLEPSIEGGSISLRAERIGDAVRIVVADTGRGIIEHDTGNNIGLGNVRKRLELMYGDRGRMVLEENEPAGVKVTIEIPYGQDTSSHS